MSQENVDRVRRMVTAFNERSVEMFMEGLDANVEFEPLLAGVTDTPYRGEAGVREWLAATDEAFEHFQLHTEHFEDHGEFVLAAE